MEPILFESSHPPVLSKPWQSHALLEDKGSKEEHFHSMDWTAVPKLDYAVTQFRQLAIPEPARVLDEVHEFVMDAYSASDAGAPLAIAHDEQPPLTAHESVVEFEENPSLEAAPSEITDADLTITDVELAEDVASVDTPVASVELLGEELLVSTVPSELIPEAEPLLDSAAFLEACEEAYQRGLIDGRAEEEKKSAASLAQALADAEKSAQAQKSQALAQQHKELMDLVTTDLALLRELTQKLEAWTENPKQLFEPLKRLSIHIAEQLLLSELNTSGAAIERLVQRCLDELNLHGTQIVTVELSPQDKSRLQDLASEMLNQIQLQAVASLQPGSVRVIANDTQVEDLVEHRLEVLAHKLLGQPEAWRDQSPFFRQPLAQRESEVQDIPQRPALPNLDSDEVLDA